WRRGNSLKPVSRNEISLKTLGAERFALYGGGRQIMRRRMIWSMRQSARRGKSDTLSLLVIDIGRAKSCACE
ncbi:hypothetical protein, partial [Stenotrophomonas maltophilia]|uniref:hypothetical protein n=1 Tax=Stenotrophomonas maltophilia TaxID=40324 RepID=UPI0021D5248D